MTHLGNLSAAVVDGELDHDARDRALAHLAGCLSCRAEVEAQRQVKARLGALRRPDAPAPLASRLAAVPSQAAHSGRPEVSPRAEASIVARPDADRRQDPGAALSRRAGWRSGRRTSGGPVDRSSGRVPRRASRRPLGRVPESTRPASIRPEITRPASARSWLRAPRRMRRAVVGGTSAIVLSLGVALLLGGSTADTAAVDPSGSTFVADHMATTGEVPLTDPAVAAVTVSFAR